MRGKKNSSNYYIWFSIYIYIYICICIKEGSFFVLFCTYEIHQIGMFQIVFLVSLESSRQGGVHGLCFHDVWTCGAKVLEYLMIFSLKIKLNRSWKFWMNWNVLLVLLETSWSTGFNGIYLIRFGFRMWEILIFKWFLLLKIQINSQKTRFWKENSNKLSTGQTSSHKYGRLI